MIIANICPPRSAVSRLAMTKEDSDPLAAVVGGELAAMRANPSQVSLSGSAVRKFDYATQGIRISDKVA